ncbi:integrase core domain-containing protein [Pseudoalteromonas piscicida]|uniref:integrase core domain-containing protein n=1 Tax=Pseudoalteromonas piscicida TaxID=43662 RepID=UPI0012FD0A7C
MGVWFKCSPHLFLPHLFLPLVFNYEWLDIYNYERPHDSLGDMTPIGYLEAA